MNKIFKLASAFKMKYSSPMKQMEDPGKKPPIDYSNVDLVESARSKRMNKEMMKNRGSKLETATPYEYSYAKRKVNGKNFEEVRDIKSGEVVARAQEGMSPPPNVNQLGFGGSTKRNYERSKTSPNELTENDKRGQLKNRQVLNERNAEYGELRKQFVADSTRTMASRQTEARQLNFRKGLTGQETLTANDKKQLSDVPSYIAIPRDKK
jgi:hypothetical protein